MDVGVYQFKKNDRCDVDNGFILSMSSRLVLHKEFVIQQYNWTNRCVRRTRLTLSDVNGLFQKWKDLTQCFHSESKMT